MPAQVHEKLVMDGQTLRMACAPGFPEGLPGIVEVENPGSGPWYSTGCARGYVGTWEIEDGRLYLAGLEGFYRLQQPGRLFAHWYSGTLVVPEGEVLLYVHMDFQSLHEGEAETRQRETDRIAATALSELAEAREKRGRAEERLVSAAEKRHEGELRIVVHEGQVTGTDEVDNHARVIRILIQADARRAAADRTGSSE